MSSDVSLLVKEGDFARDSGDLEAALTIYRKIAANPEDSALGQFKIGTVYSRMNRDEDAEQSYLEAKRLRPGYPEAINNLALLSAKRLDYAQTETLYRELLADHPDFVDAHINLCNLLIDTNRWEEAQYHGHRAVLLRPASALAHDRLGVAYKGRGRLNEAVIEFKRALELDPRLHPAWNNLGTTYFVLGMHAEADQAFRTSLDLQPAQSAAWANWLFLSNFLTMPRAEIAERHRLYGQHLRSVCGPLPVASRPQALSVGKVLRIGFVSGDFRRHSVAYFLQDALRFIDHDSFELYAYSTNRAEDAVTDRLRVLFAGWRDIRGLTDQAAAGQIQDDQIDILIDLAGHTMHSRLAVFGYKPAPIQASWIGYPNTTGMDCIDYRLTDYLVDPDAADDAFYTEKLFRLPGSFLCFSPPDEADSAVSPGPASGHNGVTFGSFNARVKLGDECIALWSKTLLAVPESRLIIKCINGVGEAPAQASLLAKFVENGVDPGRIDVRSQVVDVGGHLATYAEIDVALDSFPYNGTTTTCEALWMGVPVVALAGDRHASRVGLALLTRLGFPQWVATTPDEFAARAAELARDRNQLIELRATLRTRMQESQLLDGPAMGRQLGVAFRTMWATYCDQWLAVPTAEHSAKDALVQLKMLLGTSRFAELADAARNILLTLPNHPLALKALAAALVSLGRFDEAYPAAQRAASICATDPEAVGNLGIAATRLKHWKEAAIVFERAIRLSPNEPELWDRLATCHLILGEHARADKEFAHSTALDSSRMDAWNGWLFTSNFHTLDRQEVFERHRRFGEAVRSLCGRLTRDWQPGDSGNRKLRIGFVSGDLGQHSVAHFLEGPLTSMDRTAFALFAFSTARFDDPVAMRLKASFSGWRDLDGLSPHEAAERIREDRIDVLFDLAGHTANNGLAILGYRPAPIQVSWIGYPNTTGLDCMDYRITDHVVDPDVEEDRFYSERLLRLERPFLCYTPPANAPEVGNLPYLRNDGVVTFGSLNTRAKLGEECISLWARVLRQVPNSRLIIKSYSGLDESAARDDLMDRFAQEEIVPGRLVIMGCSASLSDHLGVYQDIDIGLDSYPYNGTTTTCEALWMGVPVISLSGDRHASRVGAALLEQVGLGACAALTPDGFVASAVELVSMPDRLQQIRSSLRARMSASPLMDIDSMGLHLGNALRAIWLEHCATPSAGSKVTKGSAAKSGPRPGQDPDSNALMRLLSADQHAEAERLARRMLLRRPDHQLAARGLSAALICLGKFSEALPIVRVSARRHPRDSELLNNLGIIQSELMLWKDAVASFQGASILSPADPEIHRNLGAAFFRMHRWSAAIPPLLKAIELHPGDYFDAIGLMALALINDNRIDEALVCFEELLKEFPEDAATHFLFAKAAMYQCRWRGLDESIARVWKECDSAAQLDFAGVTAVLSLPGITNQRILRVAQSYANQVTGRLDAAVLSPQPIQTRRLRVGYLSGDLRIHPVGFVLPKAIESHDPERVETWGFSVGPDDGSPLRSRLASAFDHFIDLESSSIAETVERIRSVSIDILVDLGGWTTHARPEALALRCAPIQVNWLGYAGTMGRATLADYILADPIVLPIEHAGFYSEAVAQLPHSFMPVDPLVELLPPPSRDSEGLPTSGVIFCSFNSCYKFNSQNFDVWCQLLRDVPGSVLWLGYMVDSAARNIRDEAEARGIDAARIVIAKFAKTRPDHLTRLQLADIALDPFPYNSHSSGTEILQAGVPMVSLLGETFAGRVGASLLHAVGLPDLVARTNADYYALAYKLAISPTELAAAKARLRGNIPTSALVDMAAFARSLEDLYARMWSDACAGVRQPLTAP